MVPVKEGWLWRRLVVVAVAVGVLCSSCEAVRPGGQVGVTLTPSSSVVLDDGKVVEEYEVCGNVMWSCIAYLRPNLARDYATFMA